MITITEEQFDEQFTPVKNHIDTNASFDGCLFETYGEEIDYITEKAQSNINQIWTILETDTKSRLKVLNIIKPAGIL